MTIWHRPQPIYKIILLLTVILITAILTGCSAPPAVSTSIVTPTPPTLTPTPTPSPTITTPAVPSPSPTPTPTSKPSPTPTSIYTPSAPPFKPTSAQIELLQYMLDLINKDRQTAGVSPVTLNFNAAAQKHAQDMFDKSYGAHWGTDGLKPYMRYTLEGGLNFESENVAYSTGSGTINVKQELQLLEHAMMYDDAASNWSHRDTIVNKWQKKVNIGIVYDAKSVALDQQFEGDYLEYTQPPTLTGNILSLSGRFKLSNVNLNNISITFDDLPQPISPNELTNNNQYHHYGLGIRLGQIFPPPPPGQVYSNFPSSAVMATKWDTDQSGQFSIQSDISPILTKGKGVYTMVLVTIIGNDNYNMTNYSIFVK